MACVSVGLLRLLYFCIATLSTIQWMSISMKNFIIYDFKAEREDLAAPIEVENFTIVLPTSYTEDHSEEARSTLQNCPFKCNVVSMAKANVRQLASAKVIIWHLIRDDLDLTLFNKLLKRRKPQQLWAFYSLEPPSVVNRYLPFFVRSVQQFNGIFNLTLTYRRDSDVEFPMITLRGYEPHSNQEAFTPKIQISGKRHLAALISNCKSDGYDRLELLEKLRRAGIQVDIYGYCGRPCPNDGSVSHFSPNVTNGCKQYLAKNYLFFAAFENSICPDYVTEKFGLSVLYDMVPVVLGGANYSRYMPPNSFLNVADFQSVTHLAGLLKQLAKNQSAFNSFFEWRSKFRLLYGERFTSLCPLCQKLYEQQSDTKNQYVANFYQDFQGWWEESRRCTTKIFKN